MKYDKKVTLYLNEKLTDKLNAIGEAEGLKLSVLIRNILIQYLK